MSWEGLRRPVGPGASRCAPTPSHPDHGSGCKHCDRNETLRQMTVTLLGLSEESLNAVLNLACRLRQLEGLRSPD